MKKWTIGEPDEKLARELAGECDIGLLPLRVLTSRGCRSFEEVQDFFRPGELEDPFLTADMQEAVDTINESVDAGEVICIYGDYDCDGVTATYVLYSFLQSMGADVRYHINERSEGYGMTVDAVRKLHEEGVQLIITVDNGISAVEEAEEAARLGVKLVITDHHQPPEVLPKALAVVDPHREDCGSHYKELAGVGVALRLCAALDDGNYDMVLEQYADIVAIGTVGDLVQLDGENRTLVQKGLLYLKNTENPGLRELMAVSGADPEKLDSMTLAFGLCPRINAAGRFASPLIALETLLAEDPDEAKRLAQRLNDLNSERKAAEAEIYKDIRAYIDSEPSVLDKRVLVLAGKGWHHGVIGIVSSRVLEDYGKPNIIISIEEDGMARGSARSVKGFNICDCLTSVSDLLPKFGGHECAGGLSIKAGDIPEFDRRVQEFASKLDVMPAAVNECDMTAEPEDLTVEQVVQLAQLRPFGVGNPTPLFFMPSCRVDKVIPLKEGRFAKLMVSYRGGSYAALVFGRSVDRLFFTEGASIDLAVNLEINEFRGQKSVSVKVKDMKPAGLDTDKYLAARDAYEKLVSGAELPRNFLMHMKPDRRELVAVYKLLKAGGKMTADDLFMRISHPNFNYCKIRIMTEVFRQAGLAEFQPSTQMITLTEPAGRTDLEQTELMRKLSAMTESGND